MALTVRAAYSTLMPMSMVLADAPRSMVGRPLRFPGHIETGSIRWRVDMVPAASLSARYIGQQFEDDVNSSAWPDAFTIDGRMGWPSMIGSLVETRVENLLDSR